MLRTLLAALAIMAVLAYLVARAFDFTRPGTVIALTEATRTAAGCLLLLAGVLRLSLHDLTGDRDGSVLGIGLVLLGGIVIPTSVLSSSLVPSPGWVTPMVRLTMVLLLVAALFWGVDRRGSLRSQPERILLTAGPALMGGAIVAAAAAMWLRPQETGWGPWGPITMNVVACLLWAVAALVADHQPWPPGGRESVFVLWTMCLGDGLRALGWGRLDGVLLLGALMVLAVAGWTATRALQDIDRATRSARQESAVRATLLADSRLDLTEESARSSALRHDALNSAAAVQAVLRALDAHADSPHLPTSELPTSELLGAALAEMAHLEFLLTRTGEDKPVEFSVDAVIAGIVEARRPTGLDVHYEPTGLQAWGSPGDFATVVQNLLVNAHLHGDGRNVTVACQTEEDYVDVSVRDSGPGVPTYAQGLIFDRGGRASSRPGAGLGLHISRELMRQQGGDLRLEKADAGAEFVARIPLPRVEQVL